MCATVVAPSVKHAFSPGDLHWMRHACNVTTPQVKELLVAKANHMGWKIACHGMKKKEKKN